MVTVKAKKEYFEGNLINSIEKGEINPILYKYTSISKYFFKNMEDSTLYYSNPNDFNDPFDCKFNSIYNYSPEAIRKFFGALRPSFNVSDEAYQATFGYLIDNPLEFTKDLSRIIRPYFGSKGVGCYTLKPDNLLMWAHYANCHKEICLKFDISKDTFHFGECYKVKYSNNLPIIDLENQEQSFIAIIGTKSSDWGYEEEIRIVQEEFGVFPFKKECLTEVIFGCRTSEENKALVKSKMKEFGYSHVIFKQTKILGDRFELEIVDASENNH